MAELMENTPQHLQKHALNGLDLGADLLMPHYQGYSLVNVAGSVAKLLGAPDFGQGALDATLLSRVGGPYKKVILLLVDALGYDLFRRMMSDQSNLVWQQNLDKAVFEPITSVSPSTTATALTTLWTGEGPAAHGVIGYEMWAKDFGMIMNNILHTSAAFRNDVGGLARAGFDPHEFLNRPLLGTHLVNNDIKATTFIHRSIARSGLSEMQMDDVDVKTFVDEADLFVSLADHLNQDPDSPEYIYVYYSDVDTLMHRFNDADPRVALQFSIVSWLLEQACLSRLSDQAKEETLLILTADHGSIATAIDSRYDLQRYPDLLDCLVMQPTCENRLAFFYVKPGRMQDIRKIFDQHWPGEFTLVESHKALEAGLFGSPPYHASVLERIGNLVAVAHGHAYLWWAPKPNHMRGRHGGLSPQEMLVPFYALLLKKVVD